MRVLATIVAIGTLGVVVAANHPPPDYKGPVKKGTGTISKSIDTHLSIRLDREATEAKLVLSKDQLKQLRAELDSVDDGSGDSASAGVTRLETIAGGVFLSLAMVFAGVWFVRSGRMTKPVAAGMIMLAGGTLATMVYANAGPPPEARKITGKMFSPAVHVYKFGGGPIKLEVSDTASSPLLIVPDPEEPKKPGDE